MPSGCEVKVQPHRRRCCLCPVDPGLARARVLVVLTSLAIVPTNSYAPGAALTATLAPALRPAFSAAPAKLLSPSALVLVSMAATAFLSHFNAPSFHKELRDNTDGRFKRLALLGFGGTFALSAAMMAAG